MMPIPSAGASTLGGKFGPHRETTIRRIKSHAVVLCLKGTAELDFNCQAIAGLGPLSDEALGSASVTALVCSSSANRVSTRWRLTS